MRNGKLIHVYKNELDKACFQHDMTCNKYKNLKGRTQSDIVLKNKAYKIATNPNYDGFQRALASMVGTFFYKRSKGIASKKGLRGCGVGNQKLVDELRKPIIKI